MELFQLWAVFWSKILSQTWPCCKRHFLFWQHNMPLSLGIYKVPFQHSFYFSSYTIKWLDHHLPHVSTILQMQHKISKKYDECCSIIIFQNSRNVNVPNFHNISSVETRETISSIHCRMKEYISKICLWNTMIKQETDQLFSQTTLNSNQIKKEYPEGIFLNINLNIFITFICWINLRITMYLSLFLKAAWSI